MRFSVWLLEGVKELMPMTTAVGTAGLFLKAP